MQTLSPAVATSSTRTPEAEVALTNYTLSPLERLCLYTESQGTPATVPVHMNMHV